MAKKKGNSYVIDEERQIAKIELKRRIGENVWTTIDLEDLDRVINFPYTWSAKYDPDLDKFYVETTIYQGYKNGKKHGKALKLHKFVMNAKENEVVDHINHDTLCNEKHNLRVIAQRNNTTNRKSKNKNNKSGFRNVCWVQRDHQWVVQLQINGKRKRLGSFPYEKLEEAGVFAEEMRRKYYGDFAGKN